MSIKLFRSKVLYLIILSLVVRAYFVVTEMRIETDFSTIFAQVLIVFVLYRDFNRQKKKEI